MKYWSALFIPNVYKIYKLKTIILILYLPTTESTQQNFFVVLAKIKCENFSCTNFLKLYVKTKASLSSEYWWKQIRLSKELPSHSMLDTSSKTTATWTRSFHIEGLPSILINKVKLKLKTSHIDHSLIYWSTILIKEVQRWFEHFSSKFRNYSKLFH